MSNQLEILGINLLQADEDYKSATQKLLDALDEMRQAMQEGKQYWIVVNGKLLRWRDGIIKIE